MASVATWNYIPSARIHPSYFQGAGQNHTSACMVPVEDQPARTSMRSLPKMLRRSRTAIWTLLRCVAWVYLNQPATSFFRFVCKLIQENRPSNIHHRPGKPRSHQSLDVQAFDGDQHVLIHQPPAELMTEVPTSCRHKFMNTLKAFCSLFMTIAATLPPSYAPLSVLDLPFASALPSRILDMVAIRECGKMRQANINANCRTNDLCTRQWSPVVNQNLTVPARCSPDDPHQFLCAGYLLSTDPTLYQSERWDSDTIPFADIRIRCQYLQAVVPAVGSKTREAKLSSSPFSIKKQFHSAVYATNCVAESLRRNRPQALDSLSPADQKPVLIVQGRRLSTTLKALDSLFECAVVGPTARTQPSLKRLRLIRGQVQLAFDGVSHAARIANAAEWSRDST